MRRPIAIASALVVLVAGVAAGCGGDDDDAEATTGTAATAVTATASAPTTTPTAPAGTASATEAVQQLKVDLAWVVADMRKQPFARGEVRLAALDERLQAISAGIASLDEANADAPGVPSASAMASLHEAEAHLRQYIEDGRAGDEIAMQLQVYRYLWTLNQLPDSLSTLYGA